MTNFIRTLQPVSIYTEHSRKSRVIRQTTENEYIPYKRIKLREKTRWYEVELEDNRLGYIKKDDDIVFKCRYVEVEDDEASGFDYSIKDEKDLNFNEVFSPTSNQELVGEHTVKSIEINRIEDKEKNKKTYVNLFYDSEVVEVTPFKIFKKERLFITYEPPYGSKENLIEVDNFNGKKGYLLKKTGLGDVRDLWLKYLGYVIIALCTIATFLGALAAGWLVIGFILVIPGLIIGFIVMFIVQIIVSILRWIFSEIYIRL